MTNPNWSKSHLVSKNLIFAAFALKKCWWITPCRNNSFTFSLQNRSEFIWSALLLSRFKIGRTNMEGYSSQAVFLLSPGTLRKKSETVFWWVSVGSGAISANSMISMISTDWIWFGFMHRHFMSCTKLWENYANLFSVSWSQSCMKSARHFTVQKAWRSELEQQH